MLHLLVLCELFTWLLEHGNLILYVLQEKLETMFRKDKEVELHYLLKKKGYVTSNAQIDIEIRE